MKKKLSYLIKFAWKSTAGFFDAAIVRAGDAVVTFIGAMFFVAAGFCLAVVVAGPFLAVDRVVVIFCDVIVAGVEFVDVLFLAALFGDEVFLADETDMVGLRWAASKATSAPPRAP